MAETLQKPKGQTIMIILGIIAELLSLLVYLIFIISILFTDIPLLESFGPVYQFIFIFFTPFLIAYDSIILFKLLKKEVEAIYMIRIILPIGLFLGSLSVVEGLYLQIVDQIYGLIGLAMYSAILLYWNNPAHIKYFRSLKNYN